MNKNSFTLHEFFKIVLIMSFAVLSMIFGLIFLKNLIIGCVLYHILSSLLIPVLIFYSSNLNRNDIICLFGLSGKVIKKTSLIGVAHGILFFLAILISYLLFKDLIADNSIETALLNWNINSHNKLFLLVPFTLFNGVIEELFWRGYVLGKLEDLVDKKFAIALSTFFYTSYHIVPLCTFFGFNFVSMSMLAGVGFAGAVWGWMRIRYRSTWPSMIGHTFATLGYVLVYLLL